MLLGPERATKTFGKGDKGSQQHHSTMETKKHKTKRANNNKKPAKGEVF